MKKNNEQLEKQNKRLPLKSDIVFKRVFSNQENKDLLKSLLEAILKIEIKNVEVKNPELPIDMADSKLGTMDIKAKTDDGTIINIEMQVKDEKNIKERSTFYMSKNVSSELKVSENYKELGKTIAINILAFNLLKRNSFHSVAHMKFEKTTEDAFIDLGYEDEEELVTDKLEMHFIELKKFIKKKLREENALNQWLWLISGKEEKVKMAKHQIKEIKRAIEVIDEMSMDSHEWELYESRQKAIMDYNSGMKSAEETGMEKGIKKGMKEGRKEGRKEGKEEGIKEGIKKGLKKGKEETAKKMLELNEDIEKIMLFTGLTKEEIEIIKKNNLL